MYPGFQFAGKGQWAARLRTGAANYHPDVNVFFNQVVSLLKPKKIRL